MQKHTNVKSCTQNSVKKLDCWVRACKDNKGGFCQRTREEFHNKPCPRIWFITGYTGTLSALEKGEDDG